MSLYETMLVTSTTLDEETAKATVEKFKNLIEANGTIDEVEEWGKRRLAYPINKEEDGVYTLIHFQSEPDFIAELERVYNITDGVLRSLVIAKSEEMEAARKAAAEKAKAAKEAAARAAEQRAAERAAAEEAQKAEQAAAAAAPVAEEPAKAEEPAVAEEPKEAAETQEQKVEE